jgi:hypothetical protein
MKEIVMEKEAFEAAISAYTDKIVDEDCQLVKYVINMSIKKDIINREGVVVAHDISRGKNYMPKFKTGRPTKITYTPLGRFESLDAAARAHGITVVAMRGKIAYSKKCGYNDFYTEDKKVRG